MRSTFVRKNSYSPGPGNYNPRLISTAHSFSVGFSKRSNLSNNNNPGPGEYGQTFSSLGGPKVHTFLKKLSYY